MNYGYNGYKISADEMEVRDSALIWSFAAMIIDAGTGKDEIVSPKS